MNKASRVYMWHGTAINLAKIVTISCPERNNHSGKYFYKVSLDSEESNTWTSTHQTEDMAEKSRNNLIESWKNYCDKVDGIDQSEKVVVESREQVEEIPVDPIESLGT